MGQPVSISANHSVWDSRAVRASVPPVFEGSEWDRLLTRLGLTEREALAAVREGREAGQPITRFVREEFRERFVPEDVLLAVNKQWRAAQQNCLIWPSSISRAS